MSLMNLSFFIWDDIIDKVKYKIFKPTLFGKFGEATAIIVGGLASAKAFSILNQIPVDEDKHQAVTKLIWDLCTRMAKAETINLRLRSQGNISSRKKFSVIKMEAADLETCLKIGAVLGTGSKVEVQHLGRYGLYLGIILELWKEFHVSVNWTLELNEKIENGSLPYSLLWASERSENLRKKLEDLVSMDSVESSDVKEVVEYTLATKVLNKSVKEIEKFADSAVEELSQLNINKSTQTLKFFVETQPKLFIESLSALEDMYG